MEWYFIVLIILGSILVLSLLILFVFFILTSCRMNKIETPDEKIKGYEDSLLAKIKEKCDKLISHKCDEIDIKSYDGTILHGYYYHSTNPKAIAILFHGYKSSPFISNGIFGGELIDKGFDVLCVSQRAHGKSGGKYITFGFKERYDCKAWCNYISEMHKDMPILLEGISLGGATVCMASDLGLGNVKMIIDDCGFTTPYEIQSFVCHSLKVPSKLIMFFFSIFYKLFAKVDIRKSDSRKALSNTNIPVLFIHGTHDPLVPYYMGVENYNACSSKKELVSVEFAGHGMSYIIDKDKCNEALSRWIKEIFSIDI